MHLLGERIRGEDIAMPTAGTHITIIERLALLSEFQEILGDPSAEDGERAKLIKFAKLGAIGPDIFYALMDYGPELQDMVNFLSKLAGSFECISEITKDIDAKIAEVEADVTLGISEYFRDVINEFSTTFDLVTGIIHEGLMALVIQNGYNFFPIFEARRQLDDPRVRWFWADYLHYVRTGAFVRELFVQSSGRPILTAFSYGYLSHYVTDVVGHPFVNQVVGSPWRMYWQRHHLVENFIDAYVWDRWHDPQPGSGIGEPPLDSIRQYPHGNIGDGAPFTFSRLHDHINIGYARGNDPVDELIHSICERIHQGLENIGLAEKILRLQTMQICESGPR
ncbi:zinc dependent phospholipase C family protein [Rhizobium beringeri]|nr:zinc dependent phospholipase C family protein [Rhizobium beringeri]WSH13857.1 zinc dependent phospholipase C family protein [Rhizobium beringeri]